MPRKEAQLWGNDVSTFDAHSIVAAQHIYRILLPAVYYPTGLEVRWEKIQALTLSSARVDGSTSWSELTELSGSGKDPVDLMQYRPAGGHMSEVTKNSLLRLLSMITNMEEAWTDEPWRYQSADASTLVPSFCATGGEGDSVTPRVPSEGGGVPRGDEQGFEGDSNFYYKTLQEMSRRWLWQGLPSRAIAASGDTGLSSVPYGDSIILSTRTSELDVEECSDLEVFAVHRYDNLPRMDL